MVEIVEKLLSSLRPETFIEDVDLVEKLLSDFSDYLNLIAQKHLKKNVLKNNDYLVELAYIDKGSLNTNTKVVNFFRASLCIAIRSFHMLIDTKHSCDWFDSKREHIRSYIFDLKPFIEFFEKKENPDFTFFRGGRNYYTNSQEIRLASNNLFWQYPQNTIFDQKIAFNLTVFTLRQSLEIRFRRICGIDEILTIDGLQKPLKHNFFPDFIKSNSCHFVMPEKFSLAHGLRIYSWTNLIIHSGYRPRIWEVQFALHFTQPLFSGGSLIKEGSCTNSIFGAVRVKGYRQLQHKLTEKIHTELSSAVNIVWLDKPEAIVESE